MLLMRWLYDLHTRLHDRRWISRVTPAMVVVILLTTFGATGISMHSYVLWETRASHPFRWRQAIILVGPNVAIIVAAIVIAIIHIRRCNPHPSQRAAKMRDAFIAMGLFVASFTLEGYLKWSSLDTRWLYEVFELVTILGLLNFCRAVYLAFMTRQVAKPQ